MAGCLHQRLYFFHHQLSVIKINITKQLACLLVSSLSSHTSSSEYSHHLLLPAFRFLLVQSLHLLDCSLLSGLFLISPCSELSVVPWLTNDVLILTLANMLINCRIGRATLTHWSFSPGEEVCR